MDLTETIAATSDQLDAVDLLGGPRTFTITRVVVKGGAEQPVDIHLAEFPRVWRPSKSMRRVLVAAWGADSTAYVGRRLTLYCDPDVTFGKDRVGGSRISHLSHIAKPLAVPLLVTRGRSAIFTVQPLADAPESPSAPTLEQIAECADVAALGEMWKAAPGLRPQIEARVAELKATPAAVDDDQPLIGGTE